MGWLPFYGYFILVSKIYRGNFGHPTRRRTLTIRRAPLLLCVGAFNGTTVCFLLPPEFRSERWWSCNLCYSATTNEGGTHTYEGEKQCLYNVMTRKKKTFYFSIKLILYLCSRASLITKISQNYFDNIKPVDNSNKQLIKQSISLNCCAKVSFPKLSSQEI